jgi:hypothetical protein
VVPGRDHCSEPGQVGDFRDAWLRAYPRWLNQIDSAFIMSYGIPVLSGVMWVLLLILA